MYYLYAKPNGFSDISEYKLHLPIFPGYVYLGEFHEKPNVDGKRYVNGEWGRGDTVPEYLVNRRKAYPRQHEVIEALWQAMDEGVLPKVVGFYDKIADVKKRFPEE